MMREILLEAIFLGGNPFYKTSQRILDVWSSLKRLCDSECEK